MLCLIVSLLIAPCCHVKASRVFTWGGGGGVSIEPPKTGEGGGVGKRAQLTDTIVINEKKLRVHFWQGLCTSCPVALLGTPQTAGVM